MTASLTYLLYLHIARNDDIRFPYQTILTVRFIDTHLYLINVTDIYLDIGFGVLHSQLTFYMHH